MFCLISFHSLDTKTRSELGMLVLSGDPSHANHPVDVRGLTVPAVGLVTPDQCSAPFTWKHCLCFYASIFIVLGINLSFHYLVRQMDKMGLEGSDDIAKVLLFSNNCLVISTNPRVTFQLLKLW